MDIYGGVKRGENVEIKNWQPKNKVKINFLK